jgi:hypothetical protein
MDVFPFEDVAVPTGKRVERQLLAVREVVPLELPIRSINVGGQRFQLRPDVGVVV